MLFESVAALEGLAAMVTQVRPAVHVHIVHVSHKVFLALRPVGAHCAVVVGDETVSFLRVLLYVTLHVAFIVRKSVSLIVTVHAAQHRPCRWVFLCRHNVLQVIVFVQVVRAAGLVLTLGTVVHL